MSTIDTIPSKVSDTAIRPDDTGNAVKLIQSFLNNQPGMKDQQELFLSTGGVDTSLTSAKIFGTYEIETRKAIRDYQNNNKSRMKKLSQATDADIEKEINFGYISYITGLVLQEDMGLKPNPVQEEIKKPVFDTPTKKLEEVLSPPAKIESVPEATFYVKTKNPTHRLALRKAPAYVKVSKEADQDEDKKGERVDMMPNGTLLKVIEPHVGYNCEWHQVEVVDPDSKWIWVKEIQKADDLFCYAEFVQPKDEKNILIPVNCIDCTEVITGSERKTPFPDWTKLTECEPFYDEETCKFYIVVQSSEENTTEERIIEQKKIAAIDGVRMLLEFYDKQWSKETLDKLVSSVGDKIIGSKDYFLDGRPSSQLKFLVGIPGKYFRAIPRTTEFLENIPTLGGILPEGWRTVSFKYGDFKANLEVVTKRFDEYAIEIDNFEGEILDYDIREENKKLKAFPKVFEQFLKWNDVPPSDDNQFEIGFSGPCFQLIYVLWKQDVIGTPLRIGLECFKQTEPVPFERTMGYVFYMLEMGKDIKKEKRRWISFINSYTCPLPRIVMSAPPKKNVEVVAKRHDEKPVKTTKEKEVEDREIETFRDKFISVRNTLMEFVGDPLLACDNSEIDKISTLDELYDKVLNKISLKSLTSFIASCVMANLSIPDINKIICDMVLKALPLDQLEKLNSLLANNAFTKVQDKLAKLSTDPKFANVTPSIRLKTAIIDGATKDEICSAINILDPGLIAFQFAKLFPHINIRLFIPPIINLKDLLPTADTLREIRALLEEAIKQAISAALLSVIKNLFKTLCKLCAARGLPKADGNFGDVNLRDELPPGIDLSKFDIPENIDDFFGDLSSILTPNELCALLNGEAPIEVLNVVKSLLRRKYPDLFISLDDTSKIKSLFLYLGKFVDPSLCAEIEKGSTTGVPSSLCEERENIKRSLLDGRMSDAQIQEQIDTEKERSKDLLKALLELTDDGILEKILPPITRDPCDKSGNNTPALRSLVPHDPPSIQKLNDQVIETMYGSIESTFDADLKGFINSLQITPNYQVNKEESGKLYDLERKLSSDLSEEEKNKKLELTVKQNSVSAIPVVLPVLRRSLKDKNNFFINTKGKLYNNLEFRYPIQDPETLALFEDLKKRAQALTKEEIKKIVADTPLIMDFFNNLNSNMFQLNRVGNTCPATLGSFDNPSQPEDVISPDAIISYRLFSKVGENKKDDYHFRILDPIFGQDGVFTNSIDIDQDIKNYFANFGLPLDASLPRATFANMIQKTYLDVVTPDSKEKIKANVKLFAYAYNELYEEIFENLVEKCTLQISNSELFDANILNNVKWQPDKEFAEDCKTSPKTSLLGVEDIMESVKQQYEREIGKCPDLLDEIASKMEPMERAGISGAVTAYVKVETIEELMRSIFVFTEFKSADLFADHSFIDYLVRRIKQGIELKDPDFYKTILRESKNIVASKGSSIKDPFDTDESMNTKKIVDDTNPDWVDGSAALEWLIKNNIKNMSSNLEEVLQFNKSENIYENLFDQWFPMRGLIESHRGYEDYLKNPLGDFTNVLTIGGAVESLAVLFQDNNAKGNFIVEKYKRFCEPLDGKTSVATADKQQKTDSKFRYGLRLSFIPSTAVNFKNDVLSISVDPALATKENSYAFMYNTDSSTGGEFTKSNKETHVIIPLAFAEEEDLRDVNLNGEEEKNKFVELKKKLVNTIEFRTLFNFVFPLKRILSLSAIYSIIGTGKEAKNAEFAFENSKRVVKNLIQILLPTNEEWWQKKLPGSDNDALREKYNSNVSTSGAPGYEALALQAVGLIAKGMAGKFDSWYILAKKLFDFAPDALPAGLSPASILGMPPVNLIPIIGVFPPLTMLGMAALAFGLLPGEKKKMLQNSEKEKQKQLENCKDKK